MEKADLKKELPGLYTAPAGDFIVVDVPPRVFFMIDGHGDPNVEAGYKEAVEALYAASYTLKFMSKTSLGKDYAVAPLEGLWWADDMTDFVTRKKQRWRWTMMIPVPSFIPDALAEAAIIKARQKRERPGLRLVRLARFDEGRSVQTLHIGSYDDEGPLIEKMHAEFLPSRRLAEAGVHHEIYLSDPRRAAPAKLRTILRQPVKPREAGGDLKPAQ